MKTFIEWLVIREEAEMLEGFSVYQNMMEIPEQELVTEYNEEIAPEFREGGHSMQRWGITAQQAQQIFGTLEHFVQIAKAAKPHVLPPSVLKHVRNYGQVTGIINAFERNANIPPQVIQKQQGRFFGAMNPNTGKGPAAGVQQGSEEIKRQQLGGYTKKDSYNHKFNLVSQNKPVVYPLLLHCNNEYSHITGHTRQTGAVSNKIILPVKVIEIGSLQPKQSVL